MSARIRFYKTSFFTVVALFVFGSTHSNAKEDAPLCVENQNTLRLPGEINRILEIPNKVTKKDILRKSTSDFCIETARAGLEKVFNKKQGGGLFSEEKLYKMAQEHPEQIDGDSWRLSQYPSSNLRKLNYENGQNIQCNKDGNYTSLRSLLVDVNMKCPWVDDLVKSAYYKNHLKNSPRLQEEDFKQVAGSLYMLCMSYTFMYASECSRALEKITRIMAPEEREQVPDVPNAIKVLRDDSYAAGASKAALKIMDRIKNHDLTGDFLSDVVSSYRESGLSQEDAEEHAWNLIEAYAAVGPSTPELLGFINNKNGVRTFLSLGVFSTALTYLDQLRLDAAKNPYSYPPEVKTTCSYGKPYHFWMTASLARKLAQEVDSPKGAMYAAYLAELGYQMKSKTYGRDPNYAFMVDVFDPTNNKVRVDVAFGAVGAVYGMKVASGEKVSSMNVDTALTNMLKNAQNIPVLSENKATKQWAGAGVSGYFRWKKIFAPDSALDTFNP